MHRTSSVPRAIYQVIILLLLSNTQLAAQEKAAIEHAISENKPGIAEAILKKQVSKFYASRHADSLNNYIFYTGKIEQLKTNTDQAVKQVTLFIDKIKTLSPSPATLRQAYIEAGEYYGFAGRNKLGYDANKEAYQYGMLVPGISPSLLALTESNMSTYAQRMGDQDLCQYHARRALRYYTSDPKVNPESLYISYNGMGSIMWNASKTDSALYYFNKAFGALEKTERNIVNKYYRPAIVQNNISALYSLEGKTTDAIRAMKLCIFNLKNFLSSKEPSQKKNSAISFQFEATDNLAGIYKELGDLRQAHELLTHSYKEKQQHLAKDDPGIFISQVLLGQLYYAMKDYDKSLQLLHLGLEGIARTEGDNILWKADATSTLALIHDAKKDISLAERYYEEADRFYEESSQGEYDNIYLDFLRNAALFYAENNMPEKALVKANKGYNYVIKTQGAQTLPGFYQLLNLTEVHYKSANYRLALDYSRQGLDVVNGIIRSSDNLLDSVKMELKKPKAILLHARSTYALLGDKTVANLMPLLKELKEGLAILEKRKAIVQDPEDIGLVMADHEDLLEFIKQVTLDLYNLTGLQEYADQLVSLHESGIYNRIRSRLDKSGIVRFAHLPLAVSKKETQLKAAFASALSGQGTHDQKMQAYIRSEERWNNFLDQLRTTYPQYYKMRYGSIFKSINEIQSFFPENTTLVRYFFTGNNLMALVADRSQKKLFRLSSANLEKNITALAALSADAVKTGEVLLALYQQLWAPLAKNIRHTNITIVPDRILYSLNFELLTPSKITSFKELATKSLLGKHAISYQYSLFLSAQKPSSPTIERNFVAFAPGFSDEIKNDYRTARKDSTELDNSYLALLPQPFTLSLAAQTKELFNGNAFMNQQSTLRSFRENAGKHKIIHIGTHAESDNIHPEYSRLIFAKDTARAHDENSLYLFDIYNCDLSSNLTVLTACESGKPGYQDGEGMLSLSHAFNYAGSESIITGLWKIDEKASAVLMEQFYKNLLEDMTKDEALRQAKLTYLAKAGGRALSPQYWAGLILTGNISPIAIKEGKSKNWIFVLIGIVLLAAGYFIRINRTKQSAD